MDSQQQQAAERIKQANNILVTVSSNPSVDQLSACIGLTLTLNKMGKHATAVFSGAVPSTIEFLQPEKTIEKNTDSLRDFIIALDKSKADKLRYKVEDRVVKIFITPYRTSINEKDLEFSQGDFNVDVILALGVHSQADLDQAITSHGRILHDATVITVNVKPGGELGGINWLDPNASSLSELAVRLIDILDKKVLDTQIATALLTGIVAETDRFSNSKTSPQTMSTSAELMGAGANQQLVATKLEEPVAPPPPPVAPIANQQAPKEGQQEESPKKPDDGTLEITHDDKPMPEAPAPESAPEQPTQDEGRNDNAKAEEKKEEELPALEHKEPEQPQQEHKDLEKQPDSMPKTEEEKPVTPVEPEPTPVAPQIHIDEHGALQPFESEPSLLPQPSTMPGSGQHDEPLQMVIQPTVKNDDSPPALTLPDSPLPSHVSDGPPAIIKHPASMPLQDAATTPKTAPAEGNSNDSELPSGAAAGDSFLVGGQPVITPPTPLEPSKQEAAPEQPKADEQAPEDHKTLSDLEKDVHSSHIDLPPLPTADPIAPTPLSSSLPPLQPQSTTQSPAFPPAGSSAPNPMFADDLLASLGNPSSVAPAPSSFDAAGLPTPSNQSPVTLPDSSNSSSGSTVADTSSPAPDEEHPTVDSARDAVAQAIGGSTPELEPIQSLNAQPVDLPLPGTPPADQSNSVPMGPQLSVQPAPMLPDTSQQPQVVAGPQMGMPDLALPGLQQPQPGMDQQHSDPNAPPPVPPPMMPPPNPF